MMTLMMMMLIPAEVCQSACQLLGSHCQYFIFDQDIRDCQLLDSGNRKCEIVIGPAKPTQEECSSGYNK